jgi:hypothetical protein
MKRFFAPVGGSSDPSKRARGDGGPKGDAAAGAGAPDAPTRQPKSFMTWNCNSFLGRMRKELDKKSFLRYVEDHDPDIIALQETWLPAAAPDRYDTFPPRRESPDDTRSAPSVSRVSSSKAQISRDLNLWAPYNFSRGARRSYRLP